MSLILSFFFFLNEIIKFYYYRIFFYIFTILLHMHLMIYPNYYSKEGKSWGAMEACEDDFDDIHEEEWQDE